MGRCSSNILSVDVEDWFHILELDGGYTRDDWGGLEARVEANTDRMLALFEESGTHATFFVVGWLAERQPELVRRIFQAGHEIGSHSYWHEVIGRHTRQSLAADLERSKKLLEDLTGAPVRGFRAAGGSITRETAWAFDVVAEAGFEFDSSVAPARSSHGGYDTPFLGPHRVRTNAGELLELPTSTFGVGRWRLPYAGGGYLRLFPYAALAAGLRFENQRGRPLLVYVHPREIDPEQPRMTLPPRRRFKYYVGLRSTEAKLRRLLRAHRFESASEWIAAHRDCWADNLFDVRAHVAASVSAPRTALAPPPPPETA